MEPVFAGVENALALPDGRSFSEYFQCSSVYNSTFRMVELCTTGMVVCLRHTSEKCFFTKNFYF